MGISPRFNTVLLTFSTNASVFSSKGEARRLIKGGGVSINKEKINDPEKIIKHSDVLNKKYILAQAGKKKYSLISITE